MYARQNGKNFYHLSFKSLQINDIVFKIESSKPLIFSVNLRHINATTTTTKAKKTKTTIETKHLR